MAKSAQAFRTIREVADWLGVAAHVLRFWESKFSQIKPVKRAGGRRYYRPADMQLVGGIKVLLHDRGMTIRGVKKMISDDGLDAVIALSPPIDAVDDNAEIIDVTPDREWEQDAASEGQASEPAATAPAREDAMSTAAPPAEGDAEDEVAPDDLDTSEPESQTGTMPQAAPEPEPDPEPEPEPAPVIADNMPASRPAAVDTASPARATPEGGVLGQLADLAQSNTMLAFHLPALRALRDRMSGTSQSQ